jgi:hypothetical protein
LVSIENEILLHVAVEGGSQLSESLMITPSPC